MARMLGTSRSFRMLKGGHKETYQREAGKTAPQPHLSAEKIDRLKAATPVTRAENRVEPPGPETDPEMLQRRRTSSGPGERSTLFHKKVTPTQHPDDPCLDASPTKSTTVLSTAELFSEQEGIIGIALGSPTMAPQNWNVLHSTDFVTQSQGTIPQISSNNQHSGPSRQVNEGEQEAPKPKISRWKSIFKKTAPPPRQNKDSFYQLAKAAKSGRLDSPRDSDSVDSGSLAQEEEVGSPAFTIHPFRGDIRPSRRVNKAQAQPPTDTRPRALTVESASSGKMKSPLSRFALSPRPHRPIEVSSTVPSLTISGASRNTSPRNPGDKPLLDVHIPDVHMERYSVMFSGLLQPQTTSTSSSLLQRRQGNTDKVKPLNGLPVKKDNGRPQDGIQRRVTSPSLPAKSPSAQLSLFPSANTSRAPSPQVTAHRPRPLERSKTAPDTSPSQETFPPQDPKKIAQETDYPDTPSLSHTSSPTSARSFDSTTEEITIVATHNAPPRPPTWRPRIEAEEPVWEIIQRQPSTVTKASALCSHPTSSTLASPAPTPTSASKSPRLVRTRSHATVTSSPRSADRLGTAQATLGIARSVSVSRATRSPDKLLSPGSPVGSPVEGGLSPGRFMGSKPLTPMLVELKNRRSQRVQLVDA